MNIAVYTANLGGYDNVYKPLVEGADFIYFTDTSIAQMAARSAGWIVLWPPPDAGMWQRVRGFMSARHQSRFIHINACRWFQGDYEVAIQHGANVQLAVDPRVVVEKYLGKADIALFRHPHRKTVAAEVEACIELKKAEPMRARAQLGHMRGNGFKDNVGLSACLFIVWRLNGKVANLQRDWWLEVQRWTAREQLSFDYVRSRHRGVKVRYIPGDPFNSPLLRYNAH